MKNVKRRNNEERKKVVSMDIIGYIILGAILGLLWRINKNLEEVIK